jgi:hypothetical protein
MHFFMALGEATLKGKLYLARLHFRPVTALIESTCEGPTSIIYCAKYQQV